MVQQLYSHALLIERILVSPAFGLLPSTDGFTVLSEALAGRVSYPVALHLFVMYAATDEEILAMFFFTENEGWLKERIAQLFQCPDLLPVVKLHKSQLNKLHKYLQRTVDQISAELEAARTDANLS